jgi:hypothetical protein
LQALPWIKAAADRSKGLAVTASNEIPSTSDIAKIANPCRTIVLAAFPVEGCEADRQLFQDIFVRMEKRIRGLRCEHKPVNFIFRPCCDAGGESASALSASSPSDALGRAVSGDP